jgi:deferrochelatase/peroxidase EfeB
VQDHLHFASFDMMAGTTREDLIELLQDWSYAASRMTQGLDVSASGAVGGSPEAPPDDTGEALGLAANGLTITFGSARPVHGRRRHRPLRTRRSRPALLTALPAFLGDDLDPITPAATCASRRAPTIRRSPCTRSAT